MNVHALVRDRIIDAARALQTEGTLPSGLDLAGVEVTAPRAAARGDFSSTAALVLARAAGMRPRQLAGRLAEKLGCHGDFETAEVAGAGFLNLRLLPSFWHGVLGAILKEGADYGRSGVGRGQRIRVAYVSPIPPGPLQLGHGRGAVVADAIASLLAFAGYEVVHSPGVGDIGPPEGIRGDLAALGVGTGLVAPGRCPPADTDDAVRAVVVASLGDGGHRTIRVCERVKLLRAGDSACLSRRSGAAPSLREVVAEVGRDAVRFTMLHGRAEAALDLALATAADQSMANPVFRVQYAHARAKSVLRNATQVFPELREGAAEVVDSDLALLTDSNEIGLIRQLALFPPLVESLAVACEVHRLAFYLYDLASSFHSQYTIGNDLPHLRSIQPGDGTLTAARLALVQANAQVLALGLELLGVLAPLEMR